jgi:hypothetical protein
MRRSASLSALAATADSEHWAEGMIGLTFEEHQRLNDFQRSEALGHLVNQAVAEAGAHGLIGLTGEDERELRKCRESS